MRERERVTQTASKRQKVGNIRQRAGDRDKQKAHDSTRHHLLPLSSKFTPQYLFGDNGQNARRHCSRIVTTTFLARSRGHLRDTAGARGSPTAAGCGRTGDSTVAQDHRTPSTRRPSTTLTPPPGLVRSRLQPSHTDTSTPSSLPAPWAPASAARSHLRATCTPEARFPPAWGTQLCGAVLYCTSPMRSAPQPWRGGPLPRLS